MSRGRPKEAAIKVETVKVVKGLYLEWLGTTQRALEWQERLAEAKRQLRAAKNDLIDVSKRMMVHRMSGGY